MLTSSEPESEPDSAPESESSTLRLRLSDVVADIGAKESGVGWVENGAGGHRFAGATVRTRGLGHHLTAKQSQQRSEWKSRRNERECLL